MTVTKEFKYKLPVTDGHAEEHSTSNNSLIIIGANGSGKSKLGAWMEGQYLKTTHRVGGQRSLTFGDYIQTKSYEQSACLLMYGHELGGDYLHPNSKARRFGVNEWEQTTTLLNDYEYVLSALIAMENNQNAIYVEECRKRDAKGETHNRVPETVIDRLKRIWQTVFPQRDIDFRDSKITVTLKNDNAPVPYKGNQMSDGERAGLYLMAQCLVIPENITIIIDEPEIHLHRSIMNRLWTEIEKERKDCFFIYITHDTQFAANHKHADKIWVKSFDGTNWVLDKINGQENSLPEQLLLDIMGNRKKVLFVEGAAGSYDTKLYSEIYKDYYVVPCGGCSTVIAFTKAMKNTPQLHDLECYGLIDRDYRNEHEIDALKQHNIFTVNVAEVENLFLVEELLKVVNDILPSADKYPNDNSRIDEIKNKIINGRYKNQKNGQICKAVVSELKYRLSSIEIEDNNEEKAKQSLKDVCTSISYDEIKKEIEQRFNAENDYKKVLRLFNCKSLSCEVGTLFGIREYKEFVMGQLRGDKAEDIKKAIINYLPNEIKI